MPLLPLDHMRPRSAGALLAVGLSALVLAACGSDSATTSGASGSSASSSADAQDTGRVRLQQCLRENGVDLGANPTAGGTPPSAATQDKLQKAIAGPCKKYQSGAFGTVSSGDRQAFQDALVKYSACMRRRGVDVPAVTLGQGVPSGARLDLGNPTVKAANAACSKLLPQGGPGGGGDGQ